MPSKKVPKRISSAERTSILAEAKAKGWTAAQIAKKCGVSKWTVYGWRKRRASGSAKPAAKRVGSAPASASVREDFRSMLSEIVRQELVKLLGTIGTSSK
ncbi:MAG: helix-turn-helix domain-containing protein [bacterium]